MDFKLQYNEYLQLVESKLAESVPDIEPKLLYEPFKYLMQGGGKRIRPILCIISCGAAGGNPLDALNCGLAIEIMHNFTLVHDDIMDESPLRRGRATVHNKWDSPTAILTGDIMLGYAYNLLPCDTKHERALRIFKAFNKGLIEVCEGQAYDMQFNCRKDVTIEEYYMMIDKKTSFLLKTSAILGAHLANASDETLTTIEKIVHNFGIAFQLQDDMLDMTAEQEKLGKKIGQDLLEGKKTFLVIKSKELSKDKEHVQLIKEFYENNGLTEEKVPSFINMVNHLGVFELSQKEIDTRLEICYNELAKLPDNYHVKMLEWLISSLNKRKY